MFKTLYKRYPGDAWNTAYSGYSENHAISEAERKKASGAFAAKVVDGDGITIHSA
jgi:hypothetical protein